MYLRTRNYTAFSPLAAGRHNKTNMTYSKEISTFTLILASMMALCTSCWNDNDSEKILYDLSNAQITEMTMESNSKVCPGLGSYKFTIDHYAATDPSLIERCKELWQKDEFTQQPGIIFNADSLPTGTEPDSIKIKLSYSSPFKVLFYQYDDELNLKNVTNFADTPTISFDDYAVTRIEVTAQDQSTNKSYFVKVNVHTLFGDTVVWNYFTPQAFEVEQVVGQRTDTIGNQLFWYTELSDGTQQLRTSQLDGDITLWSAPQTLDAASAFDLNTLYSWHNQLYAVSKEGVLLTSNDGLTWATACGSFAFANILGCQPGVSLENKIYGKEYLTAIVKQGSELHFARSVDGIDWELAALNADAQSSILPSRFPVSGYTRPICVNAQPKQGNITSRLYIVGGIDSDGQLSNSTWSCDGNSWVEFTQRELPAMQGASIVTYTRDTDKPDSFWILQPGVMAQGEVSRHLWFSENSGVTWKRLSREYSEMADTHKIQPIGCNSAFVSPKNYNIYFLGGVDAEGRQKSSIYGGQYRELNFAKIR